MVKNLVQNGYWVHATVRDASREDKVSYLEAMDAEGPGSVVIFEADLEQANEGAYDAARARELGSFSGLVIHIRYYY